MARTKGSHDIAAKVRGAFIRACKDLEDKGRPLSTIISEMLAERPKDALDTVAKFVPKEMLIEQTLEVTLAEMSDEAIDGEIARLVGEAAATRIIAGASGSVKH